MMSVEDEVELKDLLLQTLTDNGCLAKIRAQLRASVFLALEEDIKLNTKRPLLNERVKSCLNTSEGQLMFCIVKEFLEFFNLQSTMAVFDAESDLGDKYHYNGRAKVSEDLGLNKKDETVPLLQQIVHLAQQKSNRLEVNLNMTEDNLQSVDNNISNSENSIKTESELNGELSDSSSSYHSSTKENGKHNTEEESLNSINSTYENGNGNDMNKTFITDPIFTRKNSEELISKGDLTYEIGSPVLIEEVPVNSLHITMPISISDKIDEVTTPVLKDLKVSPERAKSPPKADKFKSKNSLNSLSDLPPLNMNKKGQGTILPSLYSKEFREKPNS